MKFPKSFDECLEKEIVTEEMYDSLVNSLERECENAERRLTDAENNRFSDFVKHNNYYAISKCQSDKDIRFKMRSYLSKFQRPRHKSMRCKDEADYPRHQNFPGTNTNVTNKLSFNGIKKLYNAILSDQTKYIFHSKK